MKNCRGCKQRQGYIDKAIKGRAVEMSLERIEAVARLLKQLEEGPLVEALRRLERQETWWIVTFEVPGFAPQREVVSTASQQEAETVATQRLISRGVIKDGDTYSVTAMKAVR